MTTELEPIIKLTKDLRAATATLSGEEVRYLVDFYYQIQRDRIRSANQVRAMGDSGEPHEVILWLGANTAVLERNIHRALDAYSDSRLEGRWARSIVGVGPVIAAGLLAHVDIRRAPTAGAVWRFAGLDPTTEWKKGERRPWNARLKTLCWKLGESFKKTSNHERSIYGKLYRERKALEVKRNEAGLFAEQAKQALTAKRFRENTTKRRYEEGKLPDGRLDLRAMRYAVKLFLAHFHHVCHEIELGSLPPKPYILTQREHTHYMEPPNWPM